MNNKLIVVDMQNDFITGALGSSDAKAIVGGVLKYAESFQGEVIFTRDTHGEDYMETEEGRNLPVPHCIKGTFGHAICGELLLLSEKSRVFDKESFGSPELARTLAKENEEHRIDEITLVGLCTDICVISNAFTIQAHLPNAKIRVISYLSAGVTRESHERALLSMQTCHVEVVR